MNSPENIEQGSTAWFAERRGKVTASRVADIVAKTKSGWSTSRANYMAELICERLTGETANSFKSPEMQWGTEHEAEARAAYQFHANKRVEPVGFVRHPTIGMAGGSPDGYVGEDGQVEFKCPLTATHLDTLLGGSIPARYMVQMHWQLACTGRQWCDFASFDPRLPDAMQLHVQRVPRDAEKIAELERDVIGFLAELAMKERSLRTKFGMDAPMAELENLLMAG